MALAVAGAEPASPILAFAAFTVVFRIVDPAAKAIGESLVERIKSRFRAKTQSARSQHKSKEPKNEDRKRRSTNKKQRQKKNTPKR